MTLKKYFTCFAVIALISSSSSGAPKREQPIELFRQAELAADQYKFSEASELLERYTDALPRRGKAPVSEEEFDALQARIERGVMMMDRVEKIIVIDSIAIPKKDFFAAYRLDPSAGSLRSTESVLPSGLSAIDNQPVHTPESGQTMIWSMPDSSGRGVITEISILADGSFEPAQSHPELNVEWEGEEKINALYPFLMADGVTLYYAMDHPELSMGGLDIFFTRRNGDEFMQPQNIGMPYNSPANDYMLAIDEATGTGWWATDRNSPDSDSVTIYRFIPNELRVNYNVAETPNLPSLARLDSWRDTQPTGTDYTALLALPAPSGIEKKDHEILVAIPGRGVVTSIKDLHSTSARKLAKEFISATKKLDEAKDKLATLRREYASGKRGNASEIKNLERRVTGLQETVKKTRNQLIQAEK